MRQLLVLIAALIDAEAAWLLGGVPCLLVVLAAGGWVLASYDLEKRADR